MGRRTMVARGRDWVGKAPDGRWLVRGGYARWSYRAPLFKVLTARGVGTHTPQLGPLIPLPTSGKPGKWSAKMGGKLSLCAHGWHLTIRPRSWQRVGTKVYLAEYRGTPCFGRRRRRLDGDKFCAPQVRLLKQITWVEADRLVTRAEAKARKDAIAKFLKRRKTY